SSHPTKKISSQFLTAALTQLLCFRKTLQYLTSAHVCTKPISLPPASQTELGLHPYLLPLRMNQLKALSPASSASLIPHGGLRRGDLALASAVKFGACASELRGRTFVNQHCRAVSAHRSLVVKAVASSDKETVTAGVKTGGGLRGKLNKVVLAYSGGLDTSVIVPWLRENYGCEVVCFTADVGQGIKELDGLEQKAKASGACQLVVKDLQEEFVREYIFPCLRAGAVYERKYLLGTSMARPVIAKAMVDVAKEVGADAVAHGCTGKGNDQVCVRFELTFFALNPELNVVAPWREWDIQGREDAIEYAKKHNVPVPVTKKSIYSRDRNLWHMSHEGDILEDPANEPENDMYMMSVAPEDAPNEPEYIELGIVAGLPVSVNGKQLSPASLLSELNEIGGKHGIGRIDMVENRLVGMKSRGVYETPGGTILFYAVRELESLTLDRETIQVKDSLALKYAELVYAGRWFDPLRESMDAFMEKITATTSGSVTLKLYKGSVSVAGRTSPHSLYREDISSFESGDIYDQADAAGFIRLYGLPMRVRAMLEKGI
ncbi:Argininosuccinate synthase, chloroplastic, partial [Linum perenne]